VRSLQSGKIIALTNQNIPEVKEMAFSSKKEQGKRKGMEWKSILIKAAFKESVYRKKIVQKDARL
jgi:hypothetical protein